MTKVTVTIPEEDQGIPSSDRGVRYPEVYRAAHHFVRAYDALVTELDNRSQATGKSLEEVMEEATLRSISAQILKIAEAREEMWAAIDPKREKENGKTRNS